MNHFPWIDDLNHCELLVLQKEVHARICQCQTWTRKDDFSDDGFMFPIGILNGTELRLLRWSVFDRLEKVRSGKANPNTKGFDDWIFDHPLFVNRETA